MCVHMYVRTHVLHIATTSSSGVPMSFDFDVKLLSNFPLDVYFLMDFSSTMANELATLATVANEVCKYYSHERIHVIMDVWPVG